jgi:excinuclease UvrABC nuclease subunit
MDKESLLEVIDFITSTIDELEDELVPLDEVADTDEELEKVKELQDKIDALSQLSLALMSNDWKKE